MSRCCGFVVQLVVQQIHNKANKWSLTIRNACNRSPPTLPKINAHLINISSHFLVQQKISLQCSHGAINGDRPKRECTVPAPLIFHFDHWTFYVSSYGFHCVRRAESRLCNGALNKPAYQISETTDHGGPYPVVLANDGNRVSSLLAGRCAVSGVAENPWWVVDLGTWMTISYVLITNCKLTQNNTRNRTFHRIHRCQRVTGMSKNRPSPYKANYLKNISTICFQFRS